MKKTNYSQQLRRVLTEATARSIFPAVSWGKGLEFKIAQSQTEFDAAYKLVWEVYGVEQGYIEPDDYPDLMHSDKYDKHSVLFLCLLRRKPVGTLRLILDSPLGFYIERDFSIIAPPIPREKIAELSRLAVLKKHRGGARLISFGLLRTALKFSKSNGITHWYTLIGERFKNSFHKYGVNIDPLPCNELSRQQIEERRLMEHYYKAVNPQPYIISLAGTEQGMSLR